MASPDYAGGGFDPADVREIGITVNTSEGCAGATFWPFVAYIDSFDYQFNQPVD